MNQEVPLSNFSKTNFSVSFERVTVNLMWNGFIVWFLTFAEVL